jgi:manganese/zinc/iron transport system permease protein
MNGHLIDFFLDPVLRGSVLGSIFMCAGAALIGVFVFIRKKSLIGETLSHAAYPGLILGALCCSYFSCNDDWSFVFFFIGVFFSSMLALLFLQKIQQRFFVKSDASLCFTLSSFFGIGVLLASRMQKTDPLWYRQVQTFLLGQAATMTDFHIWVYGVFLCVIAGFIAVFYPSMRIVYFDQAFAMSKGICVRFFEVSFFVLLTIAVMMAMKSVGIVLLSGMLIAPALCARQITHHLPALLWLSSAIGAISAFMGCYFSVKLSESFPFSFPTGPMIVLSSSVLCLMSLVFFAKKRASY